MRYAILFLFIFQALDIYSQNYREDFYKLSETDDQNAQSALLKTWEKDQPNNPELLIAYFNFYIYKSKKEQIRLSADQPSSESLKPSSQDTSGKPDAFMYSETYYDPKTMDTAFQYLDKGIKLNPDRLDMRFGKIYMLENMQQYEIFTNEIVKAIDRSSLNNNIWLWTDNKPLDQPKDFMLSSIQDYIFQIYDTEDDDLLPYMKQISEAILKYYPDHIASLSNISIVHMIFKEYDKALENLLKAEKLKADDTVVLSNIAYAYRMKEDMVNAIKYYELVVKYGDPDSKKYATEQIDSIKQN